MLVSTKGRYALRIMIDLAEHYTGDFIPMKSVAARQGISLKYSTKILPVLTQAGLIESVHGKGGGYRLSRQPGEYSVAEIIRLTEDGLEPISCPELCGEACDRASDCRTLGMWKEANRIINEYFEGVTIADLMGNNSADYYVI